MATRISVWTYPWDIADEGVGAALDWLQDAGFDAIELCPNYHAISTFSARNRKRSQFYSEQGAVYFPARVERYGRIKPKVFDEPEVLKAYSSASAELESRGMELNAWVIGMFQPWMARALPGTWRSRTRSATGATRRRARRAPTFRSISPRWSRTRVTNSTSAGPRWRAWGIRRSRTGGSASGS